MAGRRSTATYRPGSGDPLQMLSSRGWRAGCLCLRSWPTPWPTWPPGGCAGGARGYRTAFSVRRWSESLSATGVPIVPAVSRSLPAPRRRTGHARGRQSSTGPGDLCVDTDRRAPAGDRRPDPRPGRQLGWPRITQTPTWHRPGRADLRGAVVYGLISPAPRPRRRGTEAAVEQVAGPPRVGLGRDRGAHAAAADQPAHALGPHEPVHGVPGDRRAAVCGQLPVEPVGHLPPPVDDLRHRPPAVPAGTQRAQPVDDLGVGHGPGRRRAGHLPAHRRGPHRPYSRQAGVQLARPDRRLGRRASHCARLSAPEAPTDRCYPTIRCSSVIQIGERSRSTNSRSSATSSAPMTCPCSVARTPAIASTLSK